MQGWYFFSAAGTFTQQTGFQWLLGSGLDDSGQRSDKRRFKAVYTFIRDQCVTALERPLAATLARCCPVLGLMDDWAEVPCPLVDFERMVPI